MSLNPWARQTVAALRAGLRRPEGIMAGTRWLFAGLPLAALLITLPVALAGSHGAIWPLTLLFVALAVLAASCVSTYLRQQALLGLDLLDAAAITGVALVCPDPSAVFGIAFAGLWCRAFYGTMRQSLACSAYYAVAITAAVPLWTLVPGHTATPDLGPLLGTFPIMFLMVVVARQFGASLLARERGLRRDAALAAAGAQLLELADAGSIWTMAWTTMDEICAATAGLRILKVVREADLLHIEATAGEFAAVPPSVRGDAITVPAGAEALVSDPAPFDAAVGVQIEWVCIALNEQGADEAWMVVGVPKKMPAEAMLAVRSLVNQVTLALRNSDVHQELTMQARVDALTGLANRAAFTDELASNLANGARKWAGHVLFLDLDDFKDVNDALGHRAGDEVLIEVGSRLRRCTRPDDLCARLGGDEFAVVLRGTTEEEAVTVAQRMVAAIAEPIDINGRVAQVGASIGIAIGTPLMQMEEVVHQADVAMYAAKGHGKGRIQVFNSGLLQADTYRASFESQLGRATDAGELVVYYQPILAMADFRCIAVEALVRWLHPQQGLLEPEKFIQIAERSGAIDAIGAFVLEQACAEAASWDPADCASPVAMHVNVSAKQLDDDRFVDLVRRCLAEHLLPPEQLVLELTETVGLDSPAAIQRLKTLADLGVGIAIDDFGTGYSSLTTLRTLPVSVIKLDRTFISGALDNPFDRIVIEAIVQMSAQLGLLTIAEGIERLDQQHFLAEIGCQAVQGYLYLRAVPTPLIGAWLHNNLSNLNTPAAPEERSLAGLAGIEQ
jgi:diguanylate cyclase (GGDEF)-like protein